MDQSATTPAGSATAPPPVLPAPATVPVTRQAVTGVVPPELSEALIRDVRPTVMAGGSAVPALAHSLIKSIILAPLGWALLAPIYGKRIRPFGAIRYTLTNRRLMIQRGLKPKPTQSVELKEIDEVRLVDSTRDTFYLSGTLEVLSAGKVILTLPGVPEPEGFRRAILSAVSAWVPGKKFSPFISAAGVKNDGSATPAGAAAK